MEVRAANEDIATLRNDSRVVTATANGACRLAIFKLAVDWARQECVPRRPNSNLSVLILAKSPDKRLFVDDLLRYDSNVVSLLYFNRLSHSGPSMRHRGS